MKYFCFLLVTLTLHIASCSKEPAEIRIAKLAVGGSGNYFITFGTIEPLTVKGENNWSTTMSVNPGDTIKLMVRTANTPATLYMNVELEEGLLYCRSLYIQPQSSGEINHVVSE